MHQFQDTKDGLHGILSIDYPLMTPPVIMNGHKVHLAIEFSNWIEASYESKK